MSVSFHGVTDVLSKENAKYAEALKTAAKAFTDAENIFKDSKYNERLGWKKDETGKDGDVVYAKGTALGKMVTLSTELPGNVDLVMREAWDGVDQLPEWNDNVDYASRIALPTEHFDIYGNSEKFFISGRDFVSARIYRKLEEENGYILACRSVELNDRPEKEERVERGELHLAAVKFCQHPEKEDTTLCDVVLLADLKGMIPKAAVNKLLGKIMLMDTAANKEHLAEVSGLQ